MIHLFKVSFLSILVLLFSTHLQAEINWGEILGPPPALGSSEEQNELLYLLNLQEIRTNQECTLAAIEETVTLKTFYGMLLSNLELIKYQDLWLNYLKKLSIEIQQAKKYFPRARPFNRFSEISPCISRAEGDSYPSGHAAAARLIAYALSVQHPERAELFFKRAKAIAFNRMLGGVHFPSDVRKGQMLGDILAETYFGDDENFRNFLKYAQIYSITSSIE